MIGNNRSRKRSPGKSDLALRHLAGLHGVQTSYKDMARRRQDASVESLLAVLRTLGVPVERVSDAPDALRETQRALTHRIVEPVHVAWRGQRARIPLQLPDWAAKGPVRGRWQLADGEVRRQEMRLERLPLKRQQRLEGDRFVTLHMPVPAQLPVGYQHLVLEFGNDRFETEVFCAPERCFHGSSRRLSWGVFAPLYALHSQHTWGAGDFGDLSDFLEWVSRQGGGFVGTLPLLPAFLDRPCEPSPYSPVGRLFWNEFYLDVERAPELNACPTARRLMESADFRKRLGRLQREPLVDHPEQMALKRQILEALSRSFFAKPSIRRRAFEKYLREHPHLADYARFRAMHEAHPGSWTDWPARPRGGELRDTDCRSSLRQYHLYVQWLAHEQITELSEKARAQKVQLYLDMPLGTHRDGYDAWRYQNLFALAASGGSPPDPVFTQGQDWGFAPIHPRRSREQRHSYVRAYLRHHLRHAHMLRIDHVMGLHRLYWVPRGSPASHGAYVSYPAEEMYAILSIESHQHRAVIIGENLGTVPPEVNRSLKRHGVAGMFVVQYEARPQPVPALRRVPQKEIASMNTHDMPPFAAFWQGLDIDDRHQLGLIKRGDLTNQHRQRQRICRSLARLLRRRGESARVQTDAAAVLAAILRHLGSSDAQWLLVNLEDLWLETESQNTPGTSTERVNWRRKLRFSLEQMIDEPAWLKILRELRQTRSKDTALMGDHVT